MSHLWNVPILWRRPANVCYLFVLHDALPHAGDDLPIRERMLDREIDFQRRHHCADGTHPQTCH